MNCPIEGRNSRHSARQLSPSIAAFGGKALSTSDQFAAALCATNTSAVTSQVIFMFKRFSPSFKRGCVKSSCSVTTHKGARADCADGSYAPRMPDVCFGDGAERFQRMFDARRPSDGYSLGCAREAVRNAKRLHGPARTLLSKGLQMRSDAKRTSLRGAGRPPVRRRRRRGVAKAIAYPRPRRRRSPSASSVLIWWWGRAGLVPPTRCVRRVDGVGVGAAAELVSGRLCPHAHGGGGG